MHTSEYVQLRLLSFFRSNLKISKAVKELANLDGIKVSRNTVAKYYKLFRQDLPWGDKHQSGRPAKLLPVHYDFVDQKLEENDELTAVGKKT